MKLETVIEYLGPNGHALDPALLECEVGSFAIDSRAAGKGSVFFALSQPEYRDNGFNGDFDDSTRYAASALSNGSVAAIIRQDRYREHSSELETFRKRLIFAPDVIVGLQSVAKGVFREWNRPVVAITGSAGKTTAKEITAHVLASSGRKVLRNIKNYNNGLGHPLTVLNLASDKSFDVAVLEMGMSTPQNEIARLCRITPPDVSVVLNVLPVHVEHLGSISGVAKAKAEIVEGMKPGGTAILNADDPLVGAMAAGVDGRVLTFGLESQADVTATEIRCEVFGETRFRLTIGADSAEVTFPLSGRHNILNALAAAAVGSAFSMSAEEIATSLGTVAAPPQRGEILHFADGFTVINDSYNSNPSALIGMVKTLSESGGGARRRIVVAGEMLELGPAGADMHYEAGREMASQGVDVLFGVRGMASEIVRGAKETGMDARFFEDSAAAGKQLAAEIAEGDLVLVKGSRGVKTEIVIEKLLENRKLKGN